MSIAHDSTILLFCLNSLRTQIDFVLLLFFKYSFSRTFSFPGLIRLWLLMGVAGAK